ncbi:MAG: dihydropteroate synthase, partial [Agathobacter sp.]|nr:dihydropteroate synthase [Agathobacter sp.]
RAQAVYSNFIEEMLVDLKESLLIADKAGIAEEKIILDPGVGFAKSYEQNLEAIRCLGKIKELGYPVLLGTSRKSVIGLTLDLPSTERVEGTIVTTVAAVQQGCGFVRVHDIKENYRAIQMAQAIYKRGLES